MKLSKKTEYALRALIELAINYGKGTNVTLINDIAKRENIPPRYLEQILLILKNSGILLSKRGVGGGYTLGRPPQDISLGEVIKSIEGPVSPLGYLYGSTKHAALYDTSLGLSAIMAEVGNGLTSIVDNISLKDMAQKALDLIEQKRNIPSYAI